MATFIFIFLGFVSLGGGIVFILKGMKGDPENQDITPISDMEEIKEIKEAHFPELNEQEKQGDFAQEKQETESVKDDEETPLEETKQKESLSPEINVMKGVTSSDTIDEMQTKIVEREKEISCLRGENEKLQEALNRELSSKDQKVLAEEEQKILKEKEQENLDLKAKIDAYVEEIRSLEQKIQDYKQNLDAKRQSEDEDRELKVQNDDLNAFIEKLKKENQDLGQKLVQGHQRIEELSAQLKEMESVEKPENLSSQENQSPATIVDLEKKNSEMLKELETVSLKLRDIEQFNSHLQKKEQFLQHELTKSRAQSLGLEKICEDFKVKIEQKSN